MPEAARADPGAAVGIGRDVEHDIVRVGRVAGDAGHPGQVIEA